MRFKKNSFSLLLSGSIFLVACSFTGTTEEDMQPASGGVPGYEEYSVNRFEELHGSEKFLLFFRADWCPTCRLLEKRIKEDPSILNNHVMLEANYDREVDLKKEYGVMTQTTVIFFNEDGSVDEKRVNPRLSLIEEFFK